MLIFLFFSRLSADGQDFFTSYDEVCDTFDAMGLLENLLRGIYAYGNYYRIPSFHIFSFSISLMSIEIFCIILVILAFFSIYQ